MQVSYIQCDLCGGRIGRFSNELRLKYKARRLTPSYFSFVDGKEGGIPIGAEWKEIDVCEDCIKEIIKRKYEKDKE